MALNSRKSSFEDSTKAQLGTGASPFAVMKAWQEIV